MIKYTLNFSNPTHFSTKNNQLVVELRNEACTTKTIPMEDLGVVI